MHDQNSGDPILSDFRCLFIVIKKFQKNQQLRIETADFWLY